MSRFKPARRWQPAFYPFKREKLGKRILARFELLVKGPVYGCRMCGNCVLQETAYICPMECPKGLRNGPCGGIESENCYIDETRPCVWYRIYERAVQTGNEKSLLEVLPPLDWDKVGTDTWSDVIRRIKQVGLGKFIRSMVSKRSASEDAVWDSVFKVIRQPDWWRGDGEYHPPGYTEPVSELERGLRDGRFIITAEIAPPASTNTDKLKQKIESVKPYVTAVNFTDNSSAIPKMSGITCAHVAYTRHIEPVLQIVARDRTRTGLQSEVIGINEFGVRNILCLSGDNPSAGPEPRSSMNILDIDSIQMLWILRKMRDEAVYLDGRKIENPPKMFLGAATTPTAMPPEMQAIRDQKKVNAGAQFFQTNIIFDMEILDRWLDELDKRNVLDKVYILAGIVVLKSYKTALYLHNHIPGVIVPDTILKRLATAGDSESEVGIQIALETIDMIKNRRGINGIHLMTLGRESIIGRLVTEAGLLPGENAPAMSSGEVGMYK
jgi:methylenetetrahydrofolate reductase (NADPH)